MSTTDIELRVQLEDALVQLDMERNLRDKAEQERDEALTEDEALCLPLTLSPQRSHIGSASPAGKTMSRDRHS